MNDTVEMLVTEFNRMYGTNWSEEHKILFSLMVVNRCVTAIHERYTGDNNREDMEVLRCVNHLLEKFSITSPIRNSKHLCDND